MGRSIYWLGVSLRSQRRLGRAKVTFVAIVFSSAAMVLAQALLAGVGDTMVRNAVGVQAGHVQASWGTDRPPATDLAATAAALPGVAEALLRSRASGVLTGPRGLHAITTLYGVHPAAEARRTVIARKIVAGTYLAAPGEIIIGSPAAESLNVKVGETVTFRSGDLQQRTYRLAGIFATGISEMDRLLSYADIDGCIADSREVSIFMNDGAACEPVAAALAPLAPAGGRVQTWREMMPDLVQLLGVSEAAGRLVVLLIVVILAFGISNTMYVSVAGRTREFGILKAVGLQPSGIVLLVLGEALALTGIAAAVGVVLGSAAAWGLAGPGIDLSRWTDVNPLFVGSALTHPRASVAAAVLPLVVTVAGGLAASLPAAWRAGRMHVAEALRHL